MEPTAELFRVDRRSAVIVTRLRASKIPAEPIAPAGLYRVDDPADCALELHRLASIEDNGVLTFETFGAELVGVPKAGTYVLRSWWDRAALALVRDLARQWTRATYLGDGSECVSCPLTYKWFGRLNEPDPQLEGYCSEGVWITVGAYERFIRDDILRTRR